MTRVFVFYFILASTMAISCKTTYYQSKNSDHFRDGRFYNKEDVAQHSFLTFFKWLFTRDRKEWTNGLAVPKAEKLPEPRKNNEIRLTFVGHATFIMETPEGNIVLDPQWSERASPFTWAGPKRIQAPAVSLDDIPSINWALISHDHYDHLDLATLQTLKARFSTQFIAGLGVDASIKTEDSSINIDTLDWWQKKILSKHITIYFVPAQHFSGRWLDDRFATLWGGWLIEAYGKKIFFAGDTGYSGHFKEIAEKFPTIDLALLPIGAYEPRWVMKDMHMNPDESVRAHIDLKALRTIGMHFATFQLTDESIEQPLIDLQAALVKYKVDANSFVAPKFGQQFTLGIDIYQ